MSPAGGMILFLLPWVVGSWVHTIIGPAALATGWWPRVYGVMLAAWFVLGVAWDALVIHWTLQP